MTGLSDAIVETTIVDSTELFNYLCKIESKVFGLFSGESEDRFTGVDTIKDVWFDVVS